MKITQEMVRELQKKVDVTYEEAEYTLRRTKGDVNAAHYLIMRRRNSSSERFKKSVHDIFMQMLKYRLIITRRGKVLLDLPLFLLLLLVALDGFYRHLLPLVLILIGILAFECEVRIEKSQEVEGQDDGLFKARKVKSEKSSSPVGGDTHANSPLEIVPITQMEETQMEETQTQKTQTQKTQTKETQTSPEAKANDNKVDDYFEIVIEE